MKSKRPPYISQVAFLTVAIISLGTSIALFFGAEHALASPLWSGIVDPVRATDWSSAGVAGGIPTDRAQCGATIAAYNGNANTINNAIQNCPANGVVQLGAGTFNLTNGILLSKSNVTLRGSGTLSTILSIDGTVSDGCHIGDNRVMNMCITGSTNTGNSQDHSANWTAGYAQGATQITLTSTSSLTVGSTIWLNQLDDSSDGYPATGDLYICQSPTGQCSNQAGGEDYDTQGRGQDEGHIVTSINGNVVTITPGIRLPNFRSSQSPQAYWADNSTVLKNTGLENMTVDMTPSGGNGIYMINATNCWVKGVRIIKGSNAGSNIRDFLTVNVMNMTFADNYLYGPPQPALISNYPFAAHITSDSRIENNIFDNTSGLVMNSDYFGNVVAYNFINRSSNGPGIWEHGLGAMNLFESNDDSSIMSDVVHASHAMETMYRNILDGYAHNSQGYDNAAFTINSNNRFFNLLGNVISDSHPTHFDTYETDQAADNGAVFLLGWKGDGSGSSVANDPNVARTLMRWGNWDAVTSTASTSGNDSTGTRFVAGEVPSAIANYSNAVPANNSLPPSLYLYGAPIWWTTAWGTPAWPAIGPDVTNGNVTDSPTGGHANKIPARLCLENTSYDTTLAYSSLNPPISAFDAAICYPNDFNGSVPPPTAPVITSNPSSQSVVDGSIVALNASASGNPAPTYQWQKSTDSGSTWTAISGATNVSYNTVTLHISDNGIEYHVVATNSQGSATSSAATITVTAIPSFILTATTTGTGAGTITSSDGTINCGRGGSSCVESLLQGSSTTLHAVADSNSTFGNWAGGCSDSSVDCTITMSANTSITATFTQNVSNTGGGGGGGSIVSVSTGGGGGGSPTNIVMATTTAVNPVENNVPGCPPGFKCTLVSKDSDSNAQAGALADLITKYLPLGSTDPQVIILQKLLNGNGFPVAASGPGSAGQEIARFGPATLAAVQKFQCANAIVCSGSPDTTGYGATGPKTRNALNALSNKPISNTHFGSSRVSLSPGLQFSNTLKIGSTGQNVKQLQTFLNTHGFTVSKQGAGSPGNESTYYGPATASAIEAFQAAHADQILAPYGLTEATGFFGQATMKVINSILKSGL